MGRFRRRTRCIFWRSLHTLPVNLAIKRSSLPGASFGIWSKEYIPIGTRFGPYSDVTTEDLPGEVENDDNQEIATSEEETHPNWLGYINCTRNEEQQNLLVFNLQNPQGEAELYYLNYKPIPPNTELLIWHCKTYTKTLGIEPREYTYCENELNPFCYPGYTEKKMVRVNTFTDNLHNSVFHLRLYKRPIKKSEPYPSAFQENVEKDQLLDYEERLFFRVNPYVCHICYSRFSSVKELQVHMRAHASGSSYECDICHKVFSRIYSLHSHKQTHENKQSRGVIREKRFMCNVCDKRYTTKYSLKKHEKIHFIEEARLQYVC